MDGNNQNRPLELIYLVMDPTILRQGPVPEEKRQSTSIESIFFLADQPTTHQSIRPPFIPYLNE